jgi:hypothetical protein
MWMYDQSSGSAMKQIIIFLLLIVSGTALAEPNAFVRLSQLKAELGSVQQEQQSAYQNYQMTKELRLNEVQESSPPMGQHPYGMDIDTPPPNYEDVLRTQLERENRIQEYTLDLSRLSARFMELEKQKKLILQQIHELEQHPDE